MILLAYLVVVLLLAAILEFVILAAATLYFEARTRHRRNRNRFVRP